MYIIFFYLLVRVQKDALKGLRFAVCGLGNSLYTENFNKVAIELDRSLASLQATRISPLYCCDENTLKSVHSSLEGDFEFWSSEFLASIQKPVAIPNKSNGCCGQLDDDCCQKQDNREQVASNEELV